MYPAGRNSVFLTKSVSVQRGVCFDGVLNLQMRTKEVQTVLFSFLTRLKPACVWRQLCPPLLLFSEVWLLTVLLEHGASKSRRGAEHLCSCRVCLVFSQVLFLLQVIPCYQGKSVETWRKSWAGRSGGFKAGVEVPHWSRHCNPGWRLMGKNQI